MTKVEAIKKFLKIMVELQHREIIYNEIEKYYPEAKKSKRVVGGYLRCFI